MKKIKFLYLLSLFFILSSCNKYIGTIEPNYEPTNNVTEIFSKDSTYKEIENLSISKIIYPVSIDEKQIFNFEDINKLQAVNQNTNILFVDNKYYLNLKKNILIFDFNNDKIKINVDLDKGESFISIFEFNKNIFFITNKSRLFLLNDTSYELISEFDIFINSKPIIFDDNLILFSVFGEVNEINLNENKVTKKGVFDTNYGIANNFKLQQSNETNIYLYNSGTLLTLNKSNNELKVNYYLEDLNILSSVGIFSELLDTPFVFNDYYYFIDRSGLISLFNPISSDILWEIDVSNTIIDYSFSIEGYLILLTFNDIFIYNQNGDLVKAFKHNLDSPMSIFGVSENLHIISENGISSYNINTKLQINFIKNKFTSDIDIYLNNSNIYIQDNNYLYILE